MLVLASRSPGRRLVLEMLGIDHVVDPVDIDETRRPDEAPVPYVSRLAAEKAHEAARRHPDTWVLAADTAVSFDGRILGKPPSSSGAVKMLDMLCGNRHEVVTAVALVRNELVRTGVDATSVWLRRADLRQLEAYVATGEPMDKAGAYAAQGRGASLVERVEGDYYGVVGLPVGVLVGLLEGAGIPYGFAD